jgi:hypothetical protein
MADLLNIDFAESYMYFADGTNTETCFKASDLIWMQKDGATAIDLFFKAPVYNKAELTVDTDLNVDQAWQTRAHCRINMQCATGMGKTAMKAIVAAINSPVSVGDPNATHDRGFVVVADDLNSVYLTGITAVNGITFDEKATDATS